MEAPIPRFNWVFQVELLVCGIVTLFFLFYFNRAFSKILSFIVRIYLRWKGLPHYIDIQSLQISLLAGRIFFGRVTYHGPNETIIIVGGQLTWRYWLRRVRHVIIGTGNRGRDDVAESGAGGNSKSEGHPCRILVELKGLEWFIYNRSPAYDYVMEQMAEAGAGPDGGNSSQEDHGGDLGGQFDTAESHGEDTSTLKGSRSKAQTESTSARRASIGSLMGDNDHTGEKLAKGTSMEEEKLTVMLRVLPIKIEINRGAIVMGNNNVPGILVAHFEKADAYIDATRSQPIDKYKQLFNFSFTHPIVEMKTNKDYKEPLSSRGSRLLSNDSQDLNKAPHAQRSRRQKLRDLLPLFSDSAESLTPSVKHEPGTKKRQGGGIGTAQDKWMGLSRYLDDSQQEEGWKFEPAEYAKVTTLVDCPSARMSFYWDVPGPVPPPSTASTLGTARPENGPDEDINGSQYSPPAWGIDLAFDGGTIHYGPWADRQRVFLQNMFFPRIFKTPTPAKRLTPGQDRVPTKFRLFVELSSSTILRVPTREESKDKKYRRRMNDGEVRPFGWIEVKVGLESTISYDMSMVPGKDGWINKLNLDLKTPEVRSSVNHGLFWKADNQSLECDLSGPLKWNAKHIWRFDVLSQGLKLFILREHVTLLTDLIGDWASGPPTEYLTFTPFVYEIGLRFEDTHEVCVNVNDQNIINNPSDFEDNTFIILRGAGGLRGNVVLDMTRFRPGDSTVLFEVWLDDSGGQRNKLELGVRQPVWNTWNSFLGSEAGMKLGSVEELKLKGSYNFHSAVEPGLVDTLLLDIIGAGLKLKLFGFLIRYFLIIRENYFGENLHFKTLEEWQKQQEEGGALALADGRPAIKSNDLDVILNVDAKDCSVILPKKIYSADEGLKLNVAVVGMDMRFTNYYMDLQLDLSPISASIASSSHTSQLFVDGLTIYGHRLFGLPPTEPTYICNWDIGVGSVAGECTTEFLHTTVSALKAFRFAFEDIENALPVPLGHIAVIHDVTFVRLNVKAIQVWLHLDDGPLAFRITSGEIVFILNDLADEKHSERISLSLPDLTMACVDVRHDAGEAEARGYLETSLKMTTFGRKKEFSKHRSSQMKHVRESDYRTGRANFLIRDDFEGIGSRGSSLYNEDMDQTEPTLSLPGLPTPIHVLDDERYRVFGGSSIDCGKSSRITTSSRSKNSFLATPRSAGRAESSRRAASSHASSFHSAVESFSDALSFAPDTRSFARTPTLTTLGSQTPKPSSTPRTYSSRSIRKPSSKVRLSSPFARPNFPLEAIELDLKNVPMFAAGSEHSVMDDEPESSSASAETFIDEKTAHESILVEFTPGIRGHCTVVAIKAVARLLDCLQAKTPEDILDTIQEDVIKKLAGLAHPCNDSKIVEVSLKIPQLKFCFTNPIPQQISNSIRSLDGEKPDEDSFNLELRDFLVAARSKTIFPEHSSNPLGINPVKRILSIHLLLGGLELTLKQLLAGSSDPFIKPMLGVLVEDLLFWASSHEASNASLQIENIVSSLQSKQALFLYDVVDRTAPLIEDIEQAFGVLSTERDRMRDLAYRLAVAGARPESRVMNDPPALTRPSYVLRSSLGHVRVHDSWKVMSRMRHIYRSLSTTHKQDMDRQCIGNIRDCPLDARRQVVGAFERWRSWELVNLEHSFVVRDIFGSDLKDGAVIIPSSTKARIMVVGVKLLVDPGPMQCEFSIRNISTAVSIGSPGENNTGGLLTAEVGPSISASVMVQVHCRSIELSLTWEILDIAEGLAKALASRAGDTKPNSPDEAQLKATNTTRKKKPTFHLLWTMDTGSISLDTVNLKSLSIAYGMQASLFISEQKIELQDSLVGSALLRADLVTSELSYAGKVLSMARVHKPSFYGYFDEHCLAVTRFNIWKIAGSCESISFNIKEEVLGLMEVIDVIVNDELSQIWKLVEGMKNINPGTDSLPVPKSPSYLTRTIHVIHLTLSLENFSIEATLLPSLAYLMHGNGVRLSTRPINATEEMIIDFDVLHHEHEIRTGYDRQQTRRISALQIPVINGRVRDCISAEERLLEVFLSVEAIQLDASSLQSLFNTLNKPEVSNVIDEARAEWIGTQARLGEIFGRPKDAHVSQVKSGAPLVYRAHAGVAGLKIQTSAPSASLEVDLGSIQVHASNRPKPDSELLLIPEIHLEFRKITVELNQVSPEGPLDSCGYVELHASLLFSTKKTPRGKSVRAFFIKSRSLRVDLFAETASTIVDVAGHLQDKLKDLDLSREVKYLRKLRKSKPLIAVDYAEAGQSGIELFSSMIAVEMMGIQVSWIAGNSGSSLSNNYSRQNLVLSFKRIDFATATRKENEACLTIEEFLLEMVDSNTEQKQPGRSENSALMPEVIFNAAYFANESDRRLAIQAKGTSLDLRVTSSVVLAASDLESSIATASEKLRHASATWKSTPTESGAKRENMFGTKRLGSVLIDADFAGAVVHISNVSDSPTLPGLSSTRGGVGSPQGRYGQFAHGESNGTTILRSPGLAFKAEYVAPPNEDPSLNAEIKVSASNNTLYPSVVPLILEMTSNVKEVMRDPKEDKPGDKHSKASHDGKESPPDPAAILGRCKLNIGLRICKQEFTLSCQPIARVAASTEYKEIYVTVSTCEDPESGRFYAISATVAGLRTSVRHVYSRDSTGYLEVESVVVSLMNSKHLNGSEGLSCIMKLSPIKALLNVKQFQDFLLFREIWLPEEIRSSTPALVVPSSEPSSMLVQRYHKVAATKAFPWNTTMAISEIDLQLDLGQALGRTALLISNFWVDSRKTSDWEQTMCLGFDTIRISATGRVSGFVDLKNLKARSAIHWRSAAADDIIRAPLIQASLSLEQLQAKTSFDYQAFLVADITRFSFLMYNVQKDSGNAGDWLVGVLDGDRVHVYCTAQSASQGIALYQALLRLAQEKMASYQISLKDVERYLNRPSQSNHNFPAPSETLSVSIHKETPPPPTFLSLHTDVMVSLKEVNIGAFPSTFYDNQVFKLEALNATARFAVEMEDDRLHSKLEMTLGELRIALSQIRRADVLSQDFTVEDIVRNSGVTKGGTILKVPQVTAFMHTWNKAGSMDIDYIFKSAFEGKVDVGWNYSRVSFIKGMWATHVKSMAQRQGKSVSSSHITINTDVSPSPSERSGEGGGSEKQEKGKITAVVNVPQSRYKYNALEPPIIETPQLRDMGEATPPLEWIGLHRDRLPNLTHQIVIVSLLEIAREVEDAYSKILGTG